MIRRYGGPGMHGAGGVPLASMGGGAAASYARKVLGYGPIAYWPLWEASGTTAQCLVNAAQNGTYNSDVSTWPVGTGIGDGNTAPRFGGVADAVSLPAAYYSTMNHAEGTFMLWIQVAEAVVWTDGLFRGIYSAVETNIATNQIIALRHSDNNVLYHNRDATAGSTNTYPVNSGGPLAWFHWADVWSVSGNFIRSYFNGALGNSSTANALAGVPNAAWIGTWTAGGFWRGGLAHAACFNRVLSVPEIQALATV